MKASMTYQNEWAHQTLSRMGTEFHAYTHDSGPAEHQRKGKYEKQPGRQLPTKEQQISWQ